MHKFENKYLVIKMYNYKRIELNNISKFVNIFI